MSALSVTQRRFLAALLLTIASSAVVVGLHRQSIRTAVSAHGMLHTAVANQFLEPTSASHRLENPYFAGEPLAYYWVYHLTAARIAQVAGVHPLRAFEILAILALALIWFSAAALGGRLYGGMLPGVAVGYLAVSGTNPLGALALLWKLTVVGVAFPLDGARYLWGIAHPVMGLARIRDPYALYGPLVNFFLNVTSRPLALAFLLVMVAMLWQWLANRRVWWLAGLGLATTASTMFSPLIGLPAGATMAGSLGLMAAIRWYQGRDQVEARGWAGAAIAIIIGLIAAIPTFVSLLAQTDGGVTIGFRPSNTLGVFVSILPVAILAVGGLLRTGDGLRRRYLWAVVLSVGVLLAAAVGTTLRASNDTNFFHAAAFLLAVPAAGAFALPAGPVSRRQWAVQAAVLAFFLPSTAIVVAAYTRRPSVDLAFEGRFLQATPAGSPRDQLYHWILANTEPQSIFVLDPRPPLVTSMGNTPELPTLTGRSIFVGQEGSYMIAPYAEAARRVALAAKLVDGLPVTPADLEYLAQLDRPVFLVSRAGATSDTMALLQESYGPPVFSIDSMAVFELSLVSDDSIGDPVTGDDS